MTTPWLEIKEVRDRQVPAGPGASDYGWQVMFACLIKVLPHQEWVKLKWGFNASALFDETLERQRLFLESQYAVPGEYAMEPPERRTLAFRFINRPGEGLLLSLIAKVQARSEADATECGMAYYTELKSTFPYDYSLVPATTEVSFRQMIGAELLNDTNQPIRLTQIKRVEVPVQPNRNSPFLQGFWRSGPRAHEQVWRLLAGSTSPLLLNICLRPTILYEKEREKLLRVSEEIAQHSQGVINQNTLAALKQWNKVYIERRLAPWKKFFYLQVHLASPRELSENLGRVVGTSMTLNSIGESIPGYRVTSPRNGERQSWHNKLRNLEVVFSDSYLSIPRLSEIADLEEVFAVTRLPYSPPDDGLPGVTFISNPIH